MPRTMPTYTNSRQDPGITNELIHYYDSGVWGKFLNVQGVSQYNLSYINKPLYNEAFAKAGELFGFDDVALAALHKSIVLDVLEECWGDSYAKRMVIRGLVAMGKNWNGELYVGYYSYPLYMKYRWQDVEKKFEMTGKDNLHKLNLDNQEEWLGRNSEPFLFRNPVELRTSKALM